MISSNEVTSLSGAVTSRFVQNGDHIEGYRSQPPWHCPQVLVRSIYSVISSSVSQFPGFSWQLLLVLKTFSLTEGQRSIATIQSFSCLMLMDTSRKCYVCRTKLYIYKFPWQPDPLLVSFHFLTWPHTIPKIYSNRTIFFSCLVQLITYMTIYVRMQSQISSFSQQPQLEH